ncbi:MAG: hypothetical protein ACREMI_14585 [Gemmatimonadales bacterium]
MTRLPFALVATVMLMAGSACGGGRAQPGTAQPRTDREMLTTEELNQRSFYSAYEAVDALRPLWLSRPGLGSEVQVYVDDNRMGGVAALRSVRTLSIAFIKHLDGIQATARYGRGHDAGAILITTRAAGR